MKNLFCFFLGFLNITLNSSQYANVKQEKWIFFLRFAKYYIQQRPIYAMPTNMDK